MIPFARRGPDHGQICASRTQYQLDRSPMSKPMVQFQPCNFFHRGVPEVLILFIAGLLYLLRVGNVDNLGAYGIPSETGLLIPSGQTSPSGCF